MLEHIKLISFNFKRFRMILRSRSDAEGHMSTGYCKYQGQAVRVFSRNAA